MIQDSFLHVGVVGRVGRGAARHLRPPRGSARMPTTRTPCSTRNLDELRQHRARVRRAGIPRGARAPGVRDQAPSGPRLLFFGSQRICLFQLARGPLRARRPPTTATPDGITVIAQRRRTCRSSACGRRSIPEERRTWRARAIILGANLNPVVYRVVGTTLEYVTATENGWSPRSRRSRSRMG